MFSIKATVLLIILIAFTSILADLPDISVLDPPKHISLYHGKPLVSKHH